MPKKLTAEYYIKKYNLQPHPEGGYFGEFYKSEDQVKPLNGARYNDETRSAGTSIYYLLQKNDFSAWHVLKSDEIWHFYKGSPVKIHKIDPKTKMLSTHYLGDPEDLTKADLQVVIKAGCWFSAELVQKNSFTLVGCTVTPGFDYKDFDLADRKALTEAYPQYKSIIEKFSKETVKQETVLLI